MIRFRINKSLSAMLIAAICVVSCKINTVQDIHFDKNGCYLDSLKESFSAVAP